VKFRFGVEDTTVEFFRFGGLIGGFVLLSRSPQLRNIIRLIHRRSLLVPGVESRYREVHCAAGSHNDEIEASAGVLRLPIQQSTWLRKNKGEAPKAPRKLLLW